MQATTIVHPVLLAIAAIVSVAILIVVGVLGSRRKAATRAVLWAALVMWLLVIAAATLGSTVSGQFFGARGLNLVPFQEINRGLGARGSSAWVNVVGNVALFFPLGLAVACLVRAGFVARVLVATIVGFTLSTCIEFAQYGVGRVADVDDIILNSTGAFTGGVLGALVAAVVLGARRGRTRVR